MKKLQKINEILVIISIFIMVVVVLAQVIGRYVFSHSLTWAEELTRFLLVWISFLGAALAAKRGEHIGIDAFVNLFHGKAKLILTIIDDVLILVFWIYVAVSGISMVIQNGDQFSPAIQIPMNIVYLAIPAGGFLLAIYVLDEYRKRYFTTHKKDKGE
ncbi:TRAP transporter small permease [Petroclostridium sp. X23]|uniref:TRAP transporter small permease n=1 Tax=Petroclostridium sp. X23 TaxID=3045146 RepID=UPI0024AD1732|nr:TRAP transporter small permease [Petroclostridium sp. X23]WHH59858.1 TRAP transporter small permease [Petroclostridium sp. X23]